MDDIFDRLSSSTIFSTLDLKSGYWQIPMHANSIAKTAFSTGDGHFEFVKLPFGLRNAPAVFSKIMKAIFGNIPFVEIYIDDFTIKDFSNVAATFYNLLKKTLNENGLQSVINFQGAKEN